MCGHALAQTQGEAAATAAAAGAASAPKPAAAFPVPAPAPRPAARPAEESPVISGPSFLGLNDPRLNDAGPAKRRGSSLSIDPYSAPSSRLDYLLDDEEEHPGGGFGKIILVLLVLAAGAFGYWRWKNQGLPWLGSGAAKPAVTAQNAGAPDGESAAPANAGNTPATPAAAATDSGAGNAAANPAGASPTPAPPAGDAGTGGSADAAKAAAPAQKSPPIVARAVASAKPTRSKPAVSPRMPKPLATIMPAPVSDPVTEAQKYIYGKKVPQDCDRGLRLLRPAADQANPKAMIEMGALYSAGLCTPRDLPTAYRWFALALRKDPDNQALQGDLQKLWGEMTQPERQLAIRLSQ